MDRILVGVDFSPSSEEAAREAASLAHATGAELDVVTATRGPNTEVIRDGADTRIVSDDDVARKKLEVLAGSLTRAVGDDLRVRCSVLDGHPAKAILDEAGRTGADAIVVGNKRVHGPGRVLGSVAIDIVRHAPCSVYIVHTT